MRNRRWRLGSALAAVLAIAVAAPFVAGAIAGSEPDPVSNAARVQQEGDVQDADAQDDFFNGAETRLAATEDDTNVFVSAGEQAGTTCVSATDSEGSTFRTCAPIDGTTPAGRGVVLMYRDGGTGELKFAIAVPDGFDTARTAAGDKAINGNAVLIDAKDALDTLEVRGSAGTEEINLKLMLDAQG